MKILSPCRKCLVKPMCTQKCPEEVAHDNVMRPLIKIAALLLSVFITGVINIFSWVFIAINFPFLNSKVIASVYTIFGVLISVVIVIGITDKVDKL